MNIDFITTMLVAIAPAFSAIITIITSILVLNKKIKEYKENADQKIIDSNAKALKSYNDIAVMKTKLESMEKYLIEKKEREK